MSVRPGSCVFADAVHVDGFQDTCRDMLFWPVNAHRMIVCDLQNSSSHKTITLKSPTMMPLPWRGALCGAAAAERIQ